MPCRFVRQTERDVEVLGAESVISDAAEKSVEPVIENEYQLLKIFDCVIKLVAPRDAVFLNIRYEQAVTLLPYGPYDVFKLTAVAVYKLGLRHGEQVFDAVQPEVVKNIQCVFFYIQAVKRKLRECI